MAHAVQVENSQGELVEVHYYCSDFQAKSDPAYAGWYGSVELGVGQKCEFEGCDNFLHGADECECGDVDCYGYSQTH